MVIGKEELGIDAILFAKDGDISFIECTLAINGRQRHLQLEHIAQYGCSPALNEIKTNEKNKISKDRLVLHSESEAILSSESEKNLIDLLSNNINNKLNKKNASYKNAWLLVSFYKDAFYGELGNEKLKNISSTVISNINNAIFKRIYIIGIDSPIIGGKHFFMSI